MKKQRHKKAKMLKRLTRGGIDDFVPADSRMDSSLRDIFAPKLETLTDELINELTSDEMPRERLLEARAAGLKYNRKRDSFMSEAFSF